MQNVYDAILEGHQAFAINENCNDGARDYARGMVWSEIETSDQDIKYHNYVDTIDGVEIYYDFGADYYFFVEE